MGPKILERAPHCRRGSLDALPAGRRECEQMRAPVAGLAGARSAARRRLPPHRQRRRRHAHLGRQDGRRHRAVERDPAQERELLVADADALHVLGNEPLGHVRGGPELEQHRRTAGAGQRADPCLADELDANRLVVRPQRLGPLEQLAHGLATFVAVVAGELVTYSPTKRSASSVSRPRPYWSACSIASSRLSSPAWIESRSTSESSNRVPGAEITPRDVGTERQWEPGLEQPPFAQVDDLLQPLRLVGQLAFVDQQASVGAAGTVPPR